MPKKNRSSNAVRLLACDLDGTVIPLEDGAEHRDQVDVFRRSVESAGDVRLAYVTGRRFTHAMEGIEEHGLPAPDYLVSEVGTRIHVRGGGGFSVDEAYRASMAAAFGAETGDVRTALALHPGLTLQPDAEQGEFKASYFTSWPPPDGLIAELEGLLAGIGARANLVLSRQVETGRGLLDALPEGVAKDHAVQYLAEREGLGPERVLFAGDSGNDRAALLSGFYAVVVANAPSDLVDDLRRESERRGLSDRIHFASAPYAAGVLEGCRRFGVL